MATILRNSYKLTVGEVFINIYEMITELTNVVYHYFVDN